MSTPVHRGRRSFQSVFNSTCMGLNTCHQPCVGHGFPCLSSIVRGYLCHWYYTRKMKCFKFYGLGDDVKTMRKQERRTRLNAVGTHLSRGEGNMHPEFPGVREALPGFQRNILASIPVWIHPRHLCLASRISAQSDWSKAAGLHVCPCNLRIHGLEGESPGKNMNKAEGR